VWVWVLRVSEGDVAPSGRCGGLHLGASSASMSGTDLTPVDHTISPKCTGVPSCDSNRTARLRGVDSLLVQHQMNGCGGQRE
jgi:hypothetical protein